MAGVKRKILTLSGKGGVGKSTFTAQLGWAFAADDDLQVSKSTLHTQLCDHKDLASRQESWT